MINKRSRFLNVLSKFECIMFELCYVVFCNKLKRCMDGVGGYVDNFRVTYLIRMMY